MKQHTLAPALTKAALIDALAEFDDTAVVMFEDGNPGRPWVVTDAHETFRGDAVCRLRRAEWLDEVAE